MVEPEQLYMSNRTLLYVTPYWSDAIRATYPESWHSTAGLRKMENVVKGLLEKDVAVTIYSPLILDGSGLQYHPPARISDPGLEIDVVVPPTVNVFGIRYLNHAIMVVLSTVFVAYAFRREEWLAIMAYNFRPETALPGLLGHLVSGSPFLLEYEDGLFVHPNPVRRLTAKIANTICDPFLDGAICANIHLAEELRTENVAIVRGTPSIGMPDELPPRRYVDEENTIIMFAGHFDETRGIDVFLHLVSKLELSDVRFWISGTGRDEELRQLERKLDRLADNRILFFGTLPWEEYRARVVSADILVNLQDPTAPISRYTFPSKLLDFMSAGRLIVSTDMSDLKGSFDEEMIIDGQTNDELVRTIERTIRRLRTGGVEEYGPRAEQWVREHCQRGRMGRDIKAVIEASQP